MTRVFLERINGDLTGAVAEGLNYIGWTDIVQPGSTVFIKPNLTWPDPLPGVTTSPRFVEALLAAISQRAGRVLVGEADGGTFPAEEAFAKHHLPELCERHGATLINLSKLPATMIRDTVDGRPIQIEASRFLLEEVDVFVTVPVLKTHVVTRVTLGLKNQWGCIPNPKRLLYHHILDWGIVALNRAYRPQIALLDATYAMDRRGPLEGDAVPAGWLAISNNIVALDAVGCRLLGFDPQSVRHLRFAELEGLGTTDLNQIQFNQPLPPPIINATIQPNGMDRIAIFLYKHKLLSKLVFDSPLTNLLYRLIGRTPPGTIIQYHPENAHSAGD
jgi:uncharacterized protein (DUF362 family)